MVGRRKASTSAARHVLPARCTFGRSALPSALPGLSRLTIATTAAVCLSPSWSPSELHVRPSLSLSSNYCDPSTQTSSACHRRILHIPSSLGDAQNATIRTGILGARGDAINPQRSNVCILHTDPDACVNQRRARGPT